MKLFKNSKGTQKLGAIAAIGFAILAVGCGKQRSGQYQGIESVQSSLMVGMLPGSTSGVIRTSAVLNIQDTSSDMVSGEWNTKNANGRFTGILKADQLEILTLTRTASSNVSGLNYQSQLVGLTTDPSGVPVAICSGEYTGTLKFQGDQVTGSITPNNGGMMTGCSQIDISVTKIN